MEPGGGNSSRTCAPEFPEGRGEKAGEGASWGAGAWEGTSTVGFGEMSLECAGGLAPGTPSWPSGSVLNPH